MNNEMFNDMDSKNVIWFYLRYNLLQANWPKYIRDDSTDEDENKAYRYIFDFLLHNGLIHFK